MNLNFNRNEEIVMPAERSGKIKENYEWKVRIILQNLPGSCVQGFWFVCVPFALHSTIQRVERKGLVFMINYVQLLFICRLSNRLCCVVAHSCIRVAGLR